MVMVMMMVMLLMMRIMAFIINEVSLKLSWHFLSYNICNTCNIFFSPPKKEFCFKNVKGKMVVPRLLFSSSMTNWLLYSLQRSLKSTKKNSRQYRVKLKSFNYGKGLKLRGNNSILRLTFNLQSVDNIEDMAFEVEGTVVRAGVRNLQPVYGNAHLKLVFLSFFGLLFYSKLANFPF